MTSDLHPSILESQAHQGMPCSEIQKLVGLVEVEFGDVRGIPKNSPFNKNVMGIPRVEKPGKG